MHRKNPISVLVYNQLFPAPAPTDPPSFSAHLSKNLVGEVRIETANFYGSLDTIEARYPGLNYAHGPHRKRLGRFPHHRRLFEAFDALGLTESEIQGFCRWEGTLWARERYERDEGVTVVDTTAMEIGAWVDNRQTRLAQKGINVKTDIEVEISREPGVTAEGAGERTTSAATAPTGRSSRRTRTDRDTAMRDSSASSHSGTDMESSSSDLDDTDAHHSLSASVGFQLNARLLHAAALRDQGANVPVDPEWEAYWKEAAERGELNVDATREALRAMAGQLAQVGAASAATVASAANAAAPAAQQDQPFNHPAAPA
ncbi:hypothetical protein E8E13_008079 [Curvularia kusanoi]|uniref:Uncharacterized protein n=1 Tax=Curvularia kusanoi TaxID=90978 RepID=A0A9P4W8L2_CURKU|nr:hypothetical protein E8E13_008079 [Curvularia kusanoi]